MESHWIEIQGPPLASLACGERSANSTTEGATTYLNHRPADHQNCDAVSHPTPLLAPARATQIAGEFLGRVAWMSQLDN